MKNLVWQQNRHQKVFYRGALQYIWFVQGAWHSEIWTNITALYCFIFQIGRGDWSFVSEGLSPPKAPRGDWTVWQNFSLLFNATDSEKYLGYAICQACKRRYVKLSVYKHDRDQSDTTHLSVCSASSQNLCWDYFAFIWTQLVEIVIWQAWYTETIGWDLGVYG